MYRIALCSLAACALGACATVPAPLQGSYSTTTPRDAASDGAAVRWGGQIIEVMPKQGMTCFEVLSRELDGNARPTHRDGSQGRFIACASGFYDPEEYGKGRDLTVVGRVDGTEQGKVGQFDYTYPHVDATAVHLWAKRPAYVASPYYYDPWLSPFGPAWGYYGPGWSGWWGGPTVIVRDRPHHPHGETPPPTRRR